MQPYSAFLGHRCLGYGTLSDIVTLAQPHIDASGTGPVLVLDNATSRAVDIDFRGSIEDVLARIPVASPVEGPTEAKVGRPKLGVVAREVTLLPRHWEWLNAQPGGSSVALRKLVEEARKKAEPQQEARRRDEAVDRFMSTMAGDLPGYEEATRAYYRRDRPVFETLIAPWPPDISSHLLLIAYG